jgi:two-component system NtrC family sensor kinase
MSSSFHHDDGYYRYLTRNMIVSILLVSVAPLIVIAAAILYYFQISYREIALDHLKSMVREHARTVDNFLDERVANIRVLAESHSFEEFSDEQFLTNKLTKLRDSYVKSFVDLGVVNAAGIQVAYAGPFKLRRADYSDAEWFKQAIERHYYISDVFHGLRGLPHFIVAVRQVSSDGEVWILRATVDFERFNSLVQDIRMGKTGLAFILNKKGEFQTTPRRAVMSSTQVYMDFLRSEWVVPEKVTVVEEPDTSGDVCLHVMTSLKGGDWILAFRQNATDAYAVIHSTRALAGLIFVFGVMGIVLMAVVLSRKMVRRISEADLQKEMMNEQVIEAGKLASVGELAAGIAHEINNPVAIMVEEAGWIEDLLEDEDLKQCKSLDEFKRALTQINTQGKRCKQITQKLLSFARKTEPVAQNIQLNDLVEEVVALSQQRARYSNVKLISNLTPDLPTADVSPSEIQQVMLNLINNSLDALENGGGKVEVTTRLKGDRVVIDVEDDGPGIPKANLARIFDPFFTTKPVGKGTGLGLSICYGIVRKMGGEITVNSAVGVGTAFHVHIPISPLHKEEKKPAAVVPSGKIAEA